MVDRYVLPNGTPAERFMKFIANTDHEAENIEKRNNGLVWNFKKIEVLLIAQVYRTLSKGQILNLFTLQEEIKREIT